MVIFRQVTGDRTARTSAPPDDGEKEFDQMPLVGGEAVFSFRNGMCPNIKGSVQNGLQLGSLKSLGSRIPFQSLSRRPSAFRPRTTTMTSVIGTSWTATGAPPRLATRVDDGDGATGRRAGLRVLSEETR